MKVLVYFDKNSLEPIGGPAGYLYNLYSEITKENIEDIVFLNSKSSRKKRFIKKWYKRLPTFIQKKYKNYKREKTKYSIIDKIFSDSPKLSSCDLNEYDMVHFHSTVDMYMVKDSLEKYNGKVIITSHSPRVPYKETIEDRLSKEEYLARKEELDKLEIVDEYAFTRADFIIFPCEEAEEPYYNSWDKYSKIKEKNRSKYFYIPTGIVPITVKDTRKEIRKNYNIPEDAFVVSYMGRHNEVKGYDQLKVIGEKILKKYPECYFLIGGVEKPLTGLKHERWIEVGWTDKPHEIVNASDMFILPNKETYFDLVLLEVLSIGKAVLLTATGGNKYFKKYTDSGLYYYDYNDIDTALKQFELIYNSDYNNLGEKNKRIFNENFAINKFLANYLKVLKEIYEKEKRK